MVSLQRYRLGNQKAEVKCSLVWHLEESKGKKVGNGDSGTKEDRRWEESRDASR